MKRVLDGRSIKEERGKILGVFVCLKKWGFTKPAKCAGCLVCVWGVIGRVYGFEDKEKMKGYMSAR